MTASARHPGVNLVGFLNSANGLGVYARMVADLLIAEGVPLRILPIDLKLTARASDEDLAPYAAYHGNEPIHPINLFVFGADCGNQWFPKVRESTRVAERYNVLLPFWELNEYPEPFRALRGSIQLFLAPTRFIQHGLMHELDGAHVDYLPAAAIDIPQVPARQPGSGPFRFFYNFDIFSSVQRKQPGVLIGAYRHLTQKHPDCELILKVSGMGHPQASELVAHLRKLGGDAPGLQFVTERLPREQMLALIADSDAYVSCHRSEGLGLGLLEAMAMGVPCIATGYGGNTDFMNRDNSILIPYVLEQVQCPTYQRMLQGKPSRWAKPSVADLVRAMAAVKTDAALRARLSANGRRDARQYIEVSKGSRIGSLLQAAYSQSVRQ